MITAPGRSGAAHFPSRIRSTFPFWIGPVAVADPGLWSPLFPTGCPLFPTSFISLTALSYRLMSLH
eukprot:1023877-Prymnesium_polylepis.1